MAVQLAGRVAARGDVPLGDRCPIDRTMQLIGNRVTMILLREAFYGVRRFDALVKRTGVTEAVAAQRLKELVAAGVLTKQPYREQGQRTRHEYVLTESGHALMPTLVALLDWGNAHVAGPGPGLRLTHEGCGEPVRSELRCAAGHAVDEEQVVVAAKGDPTVH
jgi:DNA-binding HxlR family transcriptional regulator